MFFRPHTVRLKAMHESWFHLSMYVFTFYILVMFKWRKWHCNMTNPLISLTTRGWTWFSLMAILMTGILIWNQFKVIECYQKAFHTRKIKCFSRPQTSFFIFNNSYLSEFFSRQWRKKKIRQKRITGLFRLRKGITGRGSWYKSC